MVLLFVVGVMKPLWMAAAAIWIPVGENLSTPGIMTRLSGFGLLVTPKPGIRSLRAVQCYDGGPKFTSPLASSVDAFGP
jgi:hypothetical protein